MDTVTITFSLFGIRNLMKYAIKPIIKIKLTTQSEYQEIKLDEKLPISTRNPNFGKVVKFEKIPLPKEPLLWP